MVVALQTKASLDKGGGRSSRADGGIPLLFPLDKGDFPHPHPTLSYQGVGGLIREICEICG
ncbi:hypothetical protein CEE36_04645 [candidate division TA06 bacterium B3_TA06]|uniref:Uncharacterized protein n=1 Tax=candidate division TA06 bacterium B3_TA06 TaxID=2012487 RepID=A0A532V7Z2_UNCT6|nr:MAG: hypothetical protein CEE36_04645 [candidate division TA06 bacterium B3_TA06]